MRSKSYAKAFRPIVLTTTIIIDMENFNLITRNVLPLGQLRKFAGAAIVYVMALLLPGRVFAQKPAFTYSGPQVYTSGTAISPLSPANTGGTVAAIGYTAPARIASGPTANQPNVLTTNAAGDLLVATYFTTESPGGTITNLSYVVAIRAGSGRRDSLIIDSYIINSMACDAAGNLYLADGSGVVEWHPNDGSFVHLTGLPAGGVTLDGAGNIYFYTNNFTVEKIPAGGGTPTALASTKFQILGLAADPNGDVYVAGSGGVVEIPAGSSSTINVANNISYSPGVATDNGGNVYAFNGNNDVVRVMPDGSTFDIASGSNMLSLVADNLHNLYFAHYNISTDSVSVFKVSPTGGYLISPELPPGLTINPATGTISGTPAVASPATNYNITGYNANGSFGTNLNIKVNSAPAPIISYSSPQSYHKGTAITPLTPSSIGAVVSAPAFSNPSTLVLSTFYTFSNPVSIAADAAGDLLVDDPGHFSVFRLSAGATATTTVNGGVDKAGGVAFDAAGNMYLVDFEFNLVEKFPPSGPGVTLGSGFIHPAGVAVDGAGNVYVTDQGHSAVKEILAGSGAIVSIGSGFSQPNAIAVDGSGNVYVTDNANNLVKKIIPGNSTPVTVGSGFSSPKGVAVDAAGNIFVADAGNNAVKEIRAADGSTINIGSGFNAPSGVAVDGSGNLYVADSGNGVVKQLSLVGGYYINPFLPAGLSFNNITGTISGTPTAINPSTNYTVKAYNGASSGSTILTIAVVAPPVISYSTPQKYTQGITITPLAPVSSGGTIGAGGYQNTSSVVQNGGFFLATGIAVDASGAIYVADYYTTKITKIANGSFNDWGSGFDSPGAIALDAAGNLYVADAGHNAIKKVKAGNTGTVTVATGFNAPTGVAVDAAGNIYVADAGNNAVKMIPAAGGAPVTLGSGFSNPTGVAVDAAGNVYVADNGHSLVKEIIAGSNVILSLGIGLNSPNAVTIDKYGNLFIADTKNNALKMMSPGGSIVTIGSGFDQPTCVAVDTKGNVYDTDHLGVYDAGGVRSVAPAGEYFITSTLPAGLSFNQTTGVISGTPTVVSPATNYTIIGYNALGGSTATVNIQVTLNTPAISYSSPQTYMVNTAITPLAPVSSAGPVGAPAYSSSTTALTPSGGPGFASPISIAADAAGDLLVGDNISHLVTAFAAGSTTQVTISTSINIPDGVAIDASGNKYVADLNNNVIEKFPVSGSPVTVGSGFNRPTGVAVDAAGNVYVADEGNGVVKEILAGSGTIQSLGSGFSQPFAVAVDGAGNVYVSDNANSLIKKIIPGNSTPVVIGTGFSNPRGVAVDAAGNVFVADIRNNAVKEILAADGSTITIATGFNQPSGVAADGAGNVYVTDSGNSRVMKIGPTGGYFMGPVLPRGLSFNGTTGVISGTPTAFSAATNYTVTAYNTSGKSSATLNIAVNGPPGISYSATQTYTTNTAITPLLPFNSGSPIAALAYSSSAVSVGSGIMEPTDVATDAAGNLYVADIVASHVIKIPAFGSPVFLGAFNAPLGVAVDATGNVYVADASSTAIKKVPAGSSTATLIGGGFSAPTAVAVDGSGNVYVADTGNGALKEIPAGNGTPVTIKSGFASIQGVAVDASGNIYVADGGVNLNGNGAVYKIPAGGGSMVSVGTGFSRPSGVAVDAAGNLYVSDLNKTVVTVIEPNGTQLTLGSGFNQPNGLAIDGWGNVYIADSNNDALKQVNITGGYFLSPQLPAGLTFNSATGVISGTPTAPSPATNYTVTAYNSFGSSNATINITVKIAPPAISYSGPQVYTAGLAITPLLPVSSQVAAPGHNAPVNIGSGFFGPTGIALDKAGNIYVGDYFNNAVKVIPVGGGNPFVIGSGFSNPDGVAIDAAGNVYVADKGNNAIKKMTNFGTGTITSIGSGFNGPTGVAVDALGNVFVADADNNAVKEIPAGGGAVLTLGSGFNSPNGVAVDAAGNIYVADYNNNAVKEIVAGGSTVLTLGSGFNHPYGVAVDAAGNVFVGDRNNNAVKVIPYGSSTPISIGSGFNQPTHLTVDAAGNIYEGDYGSNNVKKIIPNGGYYLGSPLPAGLIFNGTSGAISGTPIVPTAPTDYTITAYNSTASAVATVNIKVVASTNANLARLATSSGVLAPAFASGTTSYTASVSNTTTSIAITPTAGDPNATIKVNGVAVASGTASAGIPLVVGNNSITTVVTAPDGVTHKTYTINVNRISNNAYLANLTISSGSLSPGFSNSNGSYTDTVTNAVTSVTVTPTLNNPYASITVNGITVASGTASANIPLTVGNNTIATVVTAQDGLTHKTYSVQVYRTSNNAYLSNLTISSGTLSPVFSINNGSYTDTVANAVTSVTVTPILNNSYASIKVNGIPVVSGTASADIPLIVGNNTITTVVTAQDGITHKTYAIKVNRISNNAYLSNLTISGGTLSPIFSKNNGSYTDTVANGVISVTVTPTLNNPNASIKVNGVTVVSGTASADIPLNVGNNTIATVVTAQDGTTHKTYTVTIKRLTPGGLNALYLPGSGNEMPLIASSPEKVGANNILSPNGDGINDIWVVKNIAFYPNNLVTVYDRAGKVVFTKKGYANDWDGTYRGSVVEEGTYYYSIDLGNGTITKGFITVVRDR